MRPVVSFTRRVGGVVLRRPAQRNVGDPLPVVVSRKPLLAPVERQRSTSTLASKVFHVSGAVTFVCAKRLVPCGTPSASVQSPTLGFFQAILRWRLQYLFDGPVPASQVWNWIASLGLGRTTTGSTACTGSSSEGVASTSL